MGLPRFASGTTASAAALNAICAEIDNLGVACKVRRTSSLSVPTGTDTVIPWQAVTFDTRGDQWNPAFPTIVNIQIPGTYIILLAERMSPTGGNGTGRRAGKILLNGTSVFANSLATDIKDASTVNEGPTVAMVATTRLYRGDQIGANVWHSANATIQTCHTDFGGTSMTLVRVAPIAV